MPLLNIGQQLLLALQQAAIISLLQFAYSFFLNRITQAPPEKVNLSNHEDPEIQILQMTLLFEC
jgi:hypothetical protein